jgi:hypothetical protein
MIISVESGIEQGRSLAQILNFDSLAMLVEVVLQPILAQLFVPPANHLLYVQLGWLFKSFFTTDLYYSGLPLCSIVLILKAQIHGSLFGIRP